MSETVRVDVSDWEAFARTLAGAKPILDKRLKAAMIGALDLIEEWIASETLAVELQAGASLGDAAHTKDAEVQDTPVRIGLSLQENP